MTKLEKFFKNNKELKSGKKEQINTIFLNQFNQFPSYIQEAFCLGYQRFFKKDNFPFDNICSLTTEELYFFSLQMDRYYSCLNFYSFHEKFKIYYESNDIKIFFQLNDLSLLKNHQTSHIKIIRGLFSLLDSQMIMIALKECNLLSYLNDITAIPELKISDSFTDNPLSVKEKIQLTKELINF